MIYYDLWLVGDFIMFLLIWDDDPNWLLTSHPCSGPPRGLAGINRSLSLKSFVAMALVSDGLRMKILSVGVDCCRVSAHGTVGMALFNEAWCKLFQVDMEIVVSNFDVAWKDGEVSFQVTGENCKIYMCPSETRGPLCSVEIFAGLGGWSQASAKMGMEPMLLIDSDMNTAYAAAKRFGIECMKANEYVEKLLKGAKPFRCVIFDEATKTDTWVAIGLVNAAYLMGSPPCQPWSTAGTASGLKCADGMAFQTVMQQSASLGIHIAILENVPGLPRHQDFRELIASIEKWDSC